MHSQGWGADADLLAGQIVSTRLGSPRSCGLPAQPGVTELFFLMRLASHVCDYRIDPLLTPETELFPKLPNLQKNRALIHGISIALFIAQMSQEVAEQGNGKEI
jgi:hypothetical protein